MEVRPGDARHRGHDLAVLVGARGGAGDLGAGVVRLGTSKGRHLERLVSGFEAFDRIVGDGEGHVGMVHNGVYLLAGPPGIGKTTLTTQIAAGLAEHGETVLLATGEEARDQVDDRARRLGVAGVPGLFALETRHWRDIEDAIRAHAGEEADPSVVIVDSTHALEVVAHGGSAGSNVQLEELATRSRNLAKTTQRNVVLIAQINADGDVRGPKALEHAVDCVLHYDQNSDAQRLLRVTKNRFGPADSLVMLTMTPGGLREVRDATPAALRAATPEPGVVAFPAMLSARASAAILVAVEASVDEVTDEMPKVVDAQGYSSKDLRRVLDTVARHTAFPLSARSVRVSVPQIADRALTDPALDLAVAAAILSAAAGRPAPPAFGRIALSGRVDPDGSAPARLRALAAAGLRAAVGPAGHRGMRGIAHVRELLDAIAPGIFAAPKN